MARQVLVFTYFVKQACGKMLLSKLRHISYATATCENKQRSSSDPNAILN